jgi:hypothetical protein
MAGTIHGTRQELLSMLGEGFHTGFRKGTDDPAAHEVWLGIRNLPAASWNDVLEFLVWGLEYSGFVTWEEDSEPATKLPPS